MAEDSEKTTRIGPKSSISMVLAGSIALGAIYVGKMETRVENLESGSTETRADVKEILRKLDDVRMHVAAMDRRSGAAEGITEERVAAHRPR